MDYFIKLISIPFSLKDNNSSTLKAVAFSVQNYSTLKLSLVFVFLSETDPADSWDVEDDAVITPEDEEVEDAEFTEGEATPKVSKKKVVKVEENRSKREHVNVVFIGHVGK